MNHGGEKDNSRRVSIGWRVVKHEKRSKIVFVSVFSSFSSRLSCYDMRELAVYILECGIRKLKPRSRLIVRRDGVNEQTQKKLNFAPSL